MAGSETEDGVAVTSEVDGVDSDQALVTRSASLAEVVNEPREIMDSARFDTDFELYDRLMEIDPELAGSVRAQAQMASGFTVRHPAMEGEQEEPTEDDRTALQDCRQLVIDLNLELMAPAIFKNMIAMGNDINKIIYEDGVGVRDLQSLPLRQVTIIDDRDQLLEAPVDSYWADTTREKIQDRDNLTDTVQDGNFYVLNEGDPDEGDEVVREEYKILHFAVDRRGNWFEDRMGRDTYGIWGSPRLEPIEFALQAKHNTLTNKVAMDDSLIAREVYKIDVETLFGHIKNDDDREDAAKSYARELKEKLEGMDPDEKPILPNEVTMEVKGPEGKAREHADFLNMMNDSIMHALTFHVGGVGRDASGPYIGNRPAKDESQNNVNHLRKIMGHKLRDLFRIHLLLKHPEWREREPDPEDISTWKLDEDIVVPKIEWTPLEDGDQERVVSMATKAYKNNLVTRNEAREMMGMDPVDEDSKEKLFEDQRMNQQINQEFQQDDEDEPEEEEEPEGDGSSDEEDQEAMVAHDYEKFSGELMEDFYTTVTNLRRDME